MNFCTFLFNEWWLNGPLAASAPRNDLELFKSIKHFAEVVAALKAFNRHTWYLTGKLVPLVFWDESVSFAEKEALSAALLNLSPNPNPTMLKRCGNGFGKLVLPDIKSQHATMSLSHYINEDSGKIFQFLHIPLTFLEKPVTEWVNEDAFAFDMEIVGTLRVCSDSAERGVKLVEDFLHLAK